MTIFSSLATRAVVPAAVAVTGFTAVCCILLYTGLKRDMEQDAVRHERELAATVLTSTRYTMLKGDRATTREIIRTISAQEGVEHLRIFNDKGLIMFSGDPSEIATFVDREKSGCVSCHRTSLTSSATGEMERARRFVNARGREVIAITSHIRNEPECFTDSCHFHRSDEKILGTIDIGFSAAPLKESLDKLRSRMLIFTVMVLVLTVGGIAAILQRTVFLPIRRLAVHAGESLPGEEAEAGDVDGEIGVIAEDLTRLEEELAAARVEIAILKARHPEETEKEVPPSPASAAGTNEQERHDVNATDNRTA